MEEIKVEEATYLGICKCCLKDGDFKSMWAEYSWEEEREIYGDMLKDCYNLDWQQPDESTEHIEQICEACIEKLRVAYYFKKQLLEAEQQLQSHFDNDRRPIKYETNITSEQVKDSVLEDEFEYEDVEFLEDEQEFFDSNLNTNDFSMNLSQESDEEDNEERQPEEWLKDEKKSIITKNYKQYLEQNIKKAVEAVKSKELTETEAALAFSVPKNILSDKILRSGRQLGQSISKATPDSEDEEPKRKWPKKKKKSEITKNYRQYSEEDLRKAIEAVKNKELTQTEAALAFNIPRKTLSFKVRNNAAKTGKRSESNTKANSNKEVLRLAKLKEYRQMWKSRLERVDSYEMDKHMNNIRIIIKHSNATPLKYRATFDHYQCCYCEKHYSLPEDLKSHTLATHENDDADFMYVRSVSSYLVKLDITGLYCRLCDEEMPSLEDLMDHLINAHNEVIFTDIPNHIIPFKFDSKELCCALCNVEYHNFRALFEHMNKHYKNYVCVECDEGFMAKSALQNHMRMHLVGKHACYLCTKVYQNLKRLNNHIQVVHVKTKKSQKCFFCDECFYSRREKKRHEFRTHKSKLIVMTCKICGKVFHSDKSYNVHLLKHSKVRLYKCDKCDMDFAVEESLKEHILKHNVRKNKSSAKP